MGWFTIPCPFLWVVGQFSHSLSLRMQPSLLVSIELKGYSSIGLKKAAVRNHLPFLFT
jgi:hypothetical protein